MKKRFLTLWFFLLFSLLVLPLASALDGTKIHDEWHHSGDYFQIGEDLFTARLNPGDYDLIRFHRNEEGYAIRIGECHETILFHFCYDNASYDPERMIINDYGQPEPGIKIIIYKRPDNSPNIEITRTFSKTTVELYEEVEVDILLENVGRRSAETLIYEEIIPEGFEVVDRINMVRIGDILRYETSVGSGYTRECSFTVRPITHNASGAFQGKAFATYAGTQYNFTSSSVTVKTPEIYTISNSLSPASVNIDSLAEFKVTITNKETDDDLRIDNLYFEVSRNLGVYYTSHRLRKITPWEYTYSGVIKPGESETFSIKAKGFYTGEYEIKGHMNSFINEHYFSDYFGKNLTIQIDKVNGIIMPNFESLRAGEPVFIRAFIQNKDVDNSYFNINATLSSELFSEQVFMEKLTPIEEVKVVSKTYTTPFYTEETKIPIYFNGTYLSETGELFSFNTERTLTLTPANKTFSFVQSIDKTSVERGDNVTVSVFVKNLKDDPEFNLEVKETLPVELDVFRGYTHKIIDVLGRENKQAYIYKFMVPVDFPFSSFNITSDLDVPSKLYHDQKVTIITVTGPLPGEDNETAEDNQTDDGQDQDQDQDGDDQDKKEKGFLSKVWNEMVEFFKVLFG